MCWHGSPGVMHSVNTAITYSAIGTFEKRTTYKDFCVMCLAERYSGG